MSEWLKARPGHLLADPVGQFKRQSTFLALPSRRCYLREPEPERATAQRIAGRRATCWPSARARVECFNLSPKKPPATRPGFLFLAALGNKWPTSGQLSLGGPNWRPSRRSRSRSGSRNAASGRSGGGCKTNDQFRSAFWPARHLLSPATSNKCLLRLLF